MASIFKDCGFYVVSIASNHCMEFGPQAMVDSMLTIGSNGVQTVGRRRNLEEARQPVYFERNAVRIALLAYCSILRTGYPAGPATPGAAPLRATAVCEPLEYQP